MDQKFSGVFAALLTPFDRNGRIMGNRLAELVDFLLAEGINGFYVCGASGECAAMTVPERMRVAEIVRNRVGSRIPLIAHVGAAGSVRNAITLARHAEKLGYDMISSLPSVNNPGKFPEVFRYYRKLAGSVSRPFLIYYKGLSFSDRQVAGFASVRNICGLKYTDFDLSRLQSLLLKAPAEWIAFSGPDELVLPALTVGTVGCIGCHQNAVPETYLEIYRNFQRGRLREAMRFQEQTARLVALSMKYRGYGGGIFVSKAILKSRGIDLGYCRPPYGKQLSPEPEKKLHAEIRKVFPGLA